MIPSEGEIDPMQAAIAMREMPRLNRDLAISLADNVIDIRAHHRRWEWIDARQREGAVE